MDIVPVLPHTASTAKHVRGVLPQRLNFVVMVIEGMASVWMEAVARKMDFVVSLPNTASTDKQQHPVVVVVVPDRRRMAFVAMVRLETASAPMDGAVQSSDIVDVLPSTARSPAKHVLVGLLQRVNFVVMVTLGMVSVWMEVVVQNTDIVTVVLKNIVSMGRPAKPHLLLR